MYRVMDQVPPILETSSIDVADVISLVDALREIIGIILSTKTKLETIPYLELLIRKFFILYDTVDNSLTTKDESPSWMTQYNFLCLLNIPDVMQKFGCLRNIWEGGVEGEGFLRKYKRKLRNGLKPKWQLWTVRNLLQRGVYDREILGNEFKWKEALAKECRFYTTFKVLAGVVNIGSPISAIVIGNIDEAKFYAVFRDSKSKSKIRGVEIEIDWENYRKCSLIKYYLVSLSAQYIDIDASVVAVSTGCLLLPKIIDLGRFQPKTNLSLYCIVYSDWR